MAARIGVGMEYGNPTGLWSFDLLLIVLAECPS
jgi:hypothetical protein